MSPYTNRTIQRSTSTINKNRYVSRSVLTLKTFNKIKNSQTEKVPSYFRTNKAQRRRFPTSILFAQLESQFVIYASESAIKTPSFPRKNPGKSRQLRADFPRNERPSLATARNQAGEFPRKSVHEPLARFNWPGKVYCLIYYCYYYDYYYYDRYRLSRHRLLLLGLKIS